jgi:hypothetical protein
MLDLLLQMLPAGTITGKRWFYPDRQEKEWRE